MSRPPVVLLHGFAGHAESWNDVALAGRETIAVTLFGHDPRAPVQAPVAFEGEVERVVAEIRLRAERVRLVGYSMGGRIALGVLATAPEIIESLVLVGAHPGLTSDAERRERRAADEVWARLLDPVGLGAMPSYWSALERATVPVELVVGALDTKFTALAERIVQRAPSGAVTLRSIDDAGHNVVLERAEVLSEILASELVAVSRSRGSA